MRKVVCILAVVMAAVGVEEAAAQAPDATANASASITIGPMLSIDVTNTTVTFDQPTFADFEAGQIGMSSAASSISTRGNVEHWVTISADAATMTYSGTGTVSDPKPASDLEWREGAGTFAGLTEAGADVITGLGVGNNTDVASVEYRMLLNSTDIPGTYSLGFTYTVTSN